MMNLSLYREDVFTHYKSNSQIARVLSEAWCSSEMYCPSCLNDRIDKLPDNTKVSDFVCEDCKNEFQLKSSSKKLGRKIVDGEFNTMIRFINSNSIPNLFLMRYSKDDWFVKKMLMVPKFFISHSIIEKRNPLSSTARRAGWTGCNILLDRIPEDGRIAIIKNEKVIEKSKVHKIWERMRFLNKKRPHLRGWMADVLKIIEDLNKEDFNIQDLYRNKEYLCELHPDNRHVEAKIRQQLQYLRDNGIVRFVSPGRYKLLKE